MTISQSHQDNDTNEVQIGMDKLTVSNNRPHSESPSQQKEVPLEKDEGRNIQAQNMPIVVCSMSLRLPGDLKTPSELYSFLINRRDARSAPDKMRFNSKTHLANSTGQHTAEGYFLRDEDISCFDPTLFSMTESELKNLDPQQRLLLQVTWEAFESAGENNYHGSNTGCFVGSFGDDWRELQGKDSPENGMYRLAGCMPFAHANRLSYEFNLTGPSVTIKTACSASGVALHLACQAIRNGECDSAIVAGVNLIFSPGFNAMMDEQGVLSPEVSCKTFDASANGYARSESANCLYIKSLDKAIRDGNPVRAIIRGSATNANGKTNGLTTPSIDAQEMLIRKAYRAAGIADHDIEKTAVVECHGTGTAVGDGIEVGALAKVFGKEGIFISSIKPNVGHSEAASGLTSVIKSVLALENRTVIPNIKFSIPNPKIPANLIVSTEPQPWPHDRFERISINNFGIGGTNVHVILDSAASYGINKSKTLMAITPPPTPGAPVIRKPTLLLFSAGHEKSLQRITESYCDYVQGHGDQLDNLAYTLTHRRVHLPLRTYGIVNETGKFISAVTPVFKCRINQGTTFVFTGQGGNYPGMGAELLQFPEFLHDIREMDTILQDLPHPPEWRIEEALQKLEISSRVNEAEFSQPICTALQIALVNHLSRHCISPSSVIGHSSGEVAAANAAGVLSVKEAMIIAYYRGYVVKHQSHRKGGMAAVGLSQESITPFLVPSIAGTANLPVIACENSMTSTTISGDIFGLQNVIAKIRKQYPDVFVRMLRVDTAWHSQHMSEIGDEYQSLIEKFIKPKKPSIPFFSSVTCDILEHAADFKASYWRRNLESPVLFRQAVKKLLTSSPPDICLEIGPHSTLSGPLKQIFAETPVVPSYVSVLTRNLNGITSFLAALGELHCRGREVVFPVPLDAKLLNDLPPYPWHLDKSYWPTSRVIRDWRSRKFPTHEILGTRTLESSDLAPTWRCLLNVDNVPWLQDHLVKQEVVFPAAGFIAIAGEIIRQLSDVPLQRFSVRDFNIKSALVLPADNIELTSHARRQTLNASEEGEWWEFEVHSCNNDVCTKHCTGLVKAGPASQAPTLLVDDNDFLRSVDSSKWYSAISRVGYNYGPAFRGLKDVRANVKSPAVLLKVTDVQEDEDLAPTYTLHPTTIDQALQSFLVARHQGQSRLLDKLFLPTQIDEIFVSSVGSRRRLKFQTIHAHISANLVGQLDNCTSSEPCFFMKGVHFSSVHDETPALDTHGAVQLIWKPDIDLTQSSTLLASTATPEHPRIQELLESLFLLCVLDVQEYISDTPLGVVNSEKPHLPLQGFWLNKFLEDPTANVSCITHEQIRNLLGYTKLQRGEIIQKIMQDFQHLGSGAGAGAAATLIVRCRDNARGLFSGQVDPLDLFLEGNTLHELYDFMNSLWSYKLFLDLFLHQQGRHLKVLEIGGGTGGLTARILEDLASGSKNGDMCAEYTFTDVSPGFFQAAKERFQKYSDRLKFRLLDIGQNPANQGFEEGYFDLAIASNVLHATPHLTQTLRHVHHLLKPGGRLLLQELCCESKWINFIMGFLPGWWLGQNDGRLSEPYISVDEWDQRLQLAGFSGIEAAVYDAGQPYQLNASIIARREHSIIPKCTKKITLLSWPNSCNDHEYLIQRELETQLILDGFSVAHLEWTPNISFLDEGDVISLLDLRSGSAFFSNLTRDNLEICQSLIQSLQNSSCHRALLWLTQACQVSPKDPQYAQVLGFARTVRVEQSVAFATLELDMVDEEVVPSICKVLQRIRLDLSLPGTHLDSDMEFAVVDGEVHIPRYQSLSVPNTLAAISNPSEAREHRATTLQIGSPGALDTLRWVEREIESLKSDMVRVDIHAAGLNFKDVVNAMGMVPSSRSDDQQGLFLGLEAAGIVTEIGSAVTHVKPGDRVILFAPESGCFATQIQTPGKFCVLISESLSFIDAAGMPCVFLTVLQSLVEKASLKRGQSILIHSAAGGVGLAAIQVSSSLGAEIFATVGSEEKADFLCREWGLERGRIFCSRDEGFLEKVMTATAGRGVDLVLNSLSGTLLHASWKCVAPGGCFLELGKRDTLGHGKLDMKMFDDNISFSGIEIAKLAVQNPDAIAALLSEMIRLYEAGIIKPINPLRVFDCQEIAQAFRLLQTGTHTGKVVVNFTSAVNTISPVLSSTPTIVFDRMKAYILVGGLGGLGTSIARWMVTHEAKYLFFLSRQPNTHHPMLAELEAMGCSVKVLACDVTIETKVQSVISTIKNNHRIGGVIQLAMALSDAVVPRMTIRNWQLATEGKIKGTVNLHKALPADLDFLILLSSLNGLTGWHGQSNYAAANTFLDSFAAWRRAQGLPCSVMDLGAVDDVGYVSENRAVGDAMRAAGNRLVSEQALLESLELAIALSEPHISGCSGVGMFETGQIGLGVSCTIPLHDPRNTVVWKDDARMAFYVGHHDSQIMTSTIDQAPGKAELSEFIKSARVNPASLNEPGRAKVLAQMIAKQLIIFLMRDGTAPIDTAISLAAFGIDSLVSIETKNWLMKNLGVQVSTLKLVNMSFEQLGALALVQLKERFP